MPKKATAQATNFAQLATQYAQAVVDRKILNCDNIIKACQRHLDDLAKVNWQYKYDEERANRACLFISNLPFSKGKWAAKNKEFPEGQKFLLQPWELFLTCSLFGWVHKSTGLRRYREAFILIPRKNGKSEWAAGVGVYMTCADGEYGAEVYVGANSEKQAWFVFGPARIMVQRSPDLQKFLGVKVNAKSLVVESTGSKMEPVIGKPGEGASVSFGVCDEFHEAETSVIYDVFKTGMGSREQPILMVISTAGSNTASPCHDLQVEAQKVLDGLENDRLFVVIFGINADTDWTHPDAIRMANPNIDVSTKLVDLIYAQEQAVKNASKANVFKTRHLNCWTNADVAFFNAPSWTKSIDKTLNEEDFKSDPLYIGIDLASKIDLTAVVKVYVKSIDEKLHYYVFPRFYLPEDRVNLPENQHYQKWAAEGYLTATHGASLDTSLVRSELVCDINTLNIQVACFDPWESLIIQQDLKTLTGCGDERIITIPQTTNYLSPAMKELDSAILDFRVHHTGNSVMNWCMSNVVAHAGKNETFFPDKSKPEHKIDGAVALINAMNRAITCDAIQADSGIGLMFV